MASRVTITILPRRGPQTLLHARPFSHSLVIRAGDKKDTKAAPIRHNPLVGNYVPATPAPATAEARNNSVSTEHPNATTTPSPDRSPVSSAEVAPNADLPPRPAPPTSAEPSTTGSAPSSTPKFPYDAASRIPRNTNPSTTPPKRTTSIDFLSMLDTRNSIHNQNAAALDPLARPKVRAAAVTGRTVFVKPFFGENAATSAPQALNVLNRLVKKQGIRSKSNYQRFHERKGLKKKRLRMVRWRMQFKRGFRETVRRVMELKRQGW